MIVVLNMSADHPEKTHCGINVCSLFEEKSGDRRMTSIRSEMQRCVTLAGQHRRWSGLTYSSLTFTKAGSLASSTATSAEDPAATASCMGLPPSSRDCCSCAIMLTLVPIPDDLVGAVGSSHSISSSSST